MTLKGSTAQACAACKYQRRRCLPECRLAPYFPSDQPKMFQNAHRLFGVSNILKILKIVDPSDHSETVRSIIYESNMRQKNPVLGCYGVIQQLYYGVRVLEEQLHAIRLQIEFYKMQQQPQQNKPTNSSNTSVLQDMDNQNNISSRAMLQLRMATPNEDDDNNNQNCEQYWGLQQPVGYGSNLMDQLEMSTDDHEQQQYLFDIHSQQQREDMLHHFESDVHLQQQRDEMLHHFEDMYPFVNCGGQSSSIIDSKIAYDLSSCGSDDQTLSLRGLMDAAGQHQMAE